MKKHLQIVVVTAWTFSMMACGPEFIALSLNKTESAISIPSRIDNGDRFADENLVEQEKPSAVQRIPDEFAAIDSTAALSGSLEQLQAQLNQRILNNAEYVVRKESHKPGIGDACNFYLQRVLELSGFSDAGYVANGFDQYAEKRFTGFKTAQFSVEPLRKDTKNLDTFLRSFPEGTPIILQWKKTVGHGHLAIVTVKDKQLIIYEASLGRFKARKLRTDARTILSASDRYRLIAYVNFMPSDK